MNCRMERVCIRGVRHRVDQQLEAEPDLPPCLSRAPEGTGRGQVSPGAVASHRDAIPGRPPSPAAGVPRRTRIASQQSSKAAGESGLFAGAVVHKYHLAPCAQAVIHDVLVDVAPRRQSRTRRRGSRPDRAAPPAPPPAHRPSVGTFRPSRPRAVCLVRRRPGLTGGRGNPGQYPVAQGRRPRPQQQHTRHYQTGAKAGSPWPEDICGPGRNFPGGRPPVSGPPPIGSFDAWQFLPSLVSNYSSPGRI